MGPSFKMHSIGRFIGAASIVAASLAMTSTAALASGFALKEQSGRALGNAFAGSTAGAEDITYSFFNPAGATRFDTPQAAIVGSYIAPTSELESSAGTAPPGPGGAPLPGSTTDDNISEHGFVPAMYGMVPVSEDLRLTLSVNTPFGLVTEYDHDWVGRFHAIRSELLTININPSVAWKVNDWFSIAAGANVMYADAELTNAAVLPTPLGLVVSPEAKLAGDDWGYGFNGGILIEPTDDVRFGFAYRSKVKLTLEGDLDFAGFPTASQNIEADLTLPDTVSVGAHWDIDDYWSVMGELQLTRWSSFDRLVVENSDTGAIISVTREEWEDTVFAAVGATYRPNSDWAIRGGLAFDESPIPEATRTPRVPGEDRYWVALGVSYSPLDWLTLDAGYTHIFMPDSEVNISGADPTDFGRGGLTASYDNSVDILSVQATIRF